jgi:hypothetical protein
MDFSDAIIALSKRIEKTKDVVLTEEAVKTSYVLPFLQALGYDVFDPHEVVPEYIADLGIKKGEKVDYAVFKQGSPILIIECKGINEKLDPHQTQLFRYFHVVSAKFALLTNGKKYLFYTDTVEPNKMDESPFLQLDLEDLNFDLLPEVKKFHKDDFDQEKILDTASELKYTRGFKELLIEEMANPSDELVKVFYKRLQQISIVPDGIVTQKTIDQFKPLLKKSYTVLVDDIINERLKKVSQPVVPANAELVSVDDALLGDEKEDSKVITTEEEKEAFLIVKAILREVVSLSRVHARDTQSYFGVLFDNNNRTPICRLFLEGKKQKRIVIFKPGKIEVKYDLETLDDLYNYTKELKEAVLQYLA